MRRWAAAAFALLALSAPAAEAAAGRTQLLRLPRAATAGEIVVLRVRAGILRRGQEIDVYADGTLLGTVSPFAVRGRREAGTYTIPLPDALKDKRRIAVTLVITEGGRPPRAPTTGELRGVALAYIKGS